mmetsp:Transcript_30138/g.70308  ORF Transcript_30138/g.70308 Transcript_30138/m.70308 type:complete len:425 (+) Transcript_30138:100-1374(+)|eukprot:CAMPEP_0178396662 /NCGR_PEP_ID=MMETSP0689_2-20121128/13843_1 /TAXON_ID=160604 /ORGANISM="Amphidinium massartii, Strain CS-259" /LENGTH=424 /DNA_ID=CAMNT_0020017341 /DNA_START=15 /DNA_END=1289 /DNA_ORIENTATION=+
MGAARSKRSASFTAPPQDDQPLTEVQNNAAENGSRPHSAPDIGRSGSASSSSRAPQAAPRDEGVVAGQKVGVLSFVRSGYSDCVAAIIRPPRANYTMQDLGPSTFRIRGRPFRREDFQLRNDSNLALECSWWVPDAQDTPPLPCVVYLHGNSSCRVDATELLAPVLQTGATLLAMDFAGCGMSEGSTITLGFREKDDARTVIEHLRSSGKVSTIALWGRSMGAATALLHGHRDPSIAAMILDSPFSSLETVARELIDHMEVRPKPKALVSFALQMVRSSIKRRNGLDILKLNPIADVHTCFIPAVFVAAKDDQFVLPHHARRIHDAYAGDKNIVMVDGTHNSRRPQYLHDSMAIFLHNRVCMPAGVEGLSEVAAEPRVFVSSRQAMGGAYPEESDDAALQRALLLSLAAAGAAQDQETNVEEVT